MKAIIRAKKPMEVRMYRMSAILRLFGKNCRWKKGTSDFSEVERLFA
jgi:hypothetical protein